MLIGEIFEVCSHPAGMRVGEISRMCLLYTGMLLGGKLWIGLLSLRLVNRRLFFLLLGLIHERDP